MTNLRANALASLLFFGSVACSAADVAAHRLVRLEDGSVWGWGGNAWGQLDPTLAASVPQPVQLRLAAGTQQVTTGLRHSLGIAADGSVWAWGDNTSGQLGLPAIKALPGKVQVKLPQAAEAVAAGAQHSIALLADGSVWSWGANQRGQLGRADAGPFALGQPPAAVTGLPAPALFIAAGADFSVALLATGAVWTWGAGSGTPVQLALPATPTRIRAWGGTGIVRDRTGKYWRWSPESPKAVASSEQDFDALEGLRAPFLQITGRVAPRTAGRASVSGPGQCSAVKADGRFSCRVPFGWNGVIAFRPATGGVDRRPVSIVTTTADIDFTLPQDSAVQAERAGAIVSPVSAPAASSREP